MGTFSMDVHGIFITNPDVTYTRTYFVLIWESSKWTNDQITSVGVVVYHVHGKAECIIDILVYYNRDHGHIVLKDLIVVYVYCINNVPFF